MNQGGAKVASKLAAGGLFFVVDVQNHMAQWGTLTNIVGVGKTYENGILEALKVYQGR